jgi:exodeoxyribonuclease VII small subunit
MAKKPETPSLEEQLKRLEEIAQILDRGDVPLEDQLALFSEGMALATACREYLEQAELRVKRLTE